jgi:hypothetical protein
VKSDKRARNESCNCDTRPVKFDICRSITLRGAVRNERRERIDCGVVVFVDISFDGLTALRNEYGRGFIATDGIDGRSCDVNEVDVCIRTDDGIGGVKFALIYDCDEAGADVDVWIEVLFVRVDDNVFICACFDVWVTTGVNGASNV